MVYFKYVKGDNMVLAYFKKIKLQWIEWIKKTPYF